MMSDSVSRIKLVVAIAVNERQLMTLDEALEENGIIDDQIVSQAEWAVLSSQVHSQIIDDIQK